ncbi:twitching motility protein PilT [Phytoactinopolyspora halotolerans]|uniref:Twitching motility protein PilT n=2 Tax=Phytoactinopolyspora halotolerans TaxID=1981512 RepID=A0A6L9SHW5_9ACTN|nr:twitching motility protein PilT [Phytoactinopolyspora halotolerans]
MPVVLDSGALVAVDRNGTRHLARLKEAEKRVDRLVTHPFVVAQVWRKGTQAQLARFLKSVDVRDIDERLGRQCGELIGKAGTSDPIDAAVVLHAEDGDRILTSDSRDIERLADARGRKVRIVPV